MMRKCVYFVTLIFLFSIAAPALANNVYHAGNGNPDVNGVPEWNPAVSKYWSDGNNWVAWTPDWSTRFQPYTPTSDDLVYLNRGGYLSEVDIGTAAAANDLHVSYWNANPPTPGNPMLSVTGGTLDITDLLSVGTADAGEVGEMYISGGATTVGGNFDISGEAWSTSGNGIVDMSGGTVNVSGDLRVGMYAGTGDLTLSGGTISADDLLMTAKGSIVITGTGMIILNGDETATINGTYVPNGWLSGIAEFHIFGPYEGKTTVVVPEPTTLALLGIGGLVLLRRKK